jgi:hypothetical protein
MLFRLRRAICIRWLINFSVSLTNFRLAAEDEASVGVGAVLIDSPTGTMPAITDFGHFGSDRFLPTIYRSSDLESFPAEQAIEFTHQGSFEVSAGVTSKIFFGLRLDVGATDGLVFGHGAASISHPPGATLNTDPNNPFNSSVVPPPSGRYQRST